MLAIQKSAFYVCDHSTILKLCKELFPFNSIFVSNISVM